MRSERAALQIRAQRVFFFSFSIQVSLATPFVQQRGSFEMTIDCWLVAAMAPTYPWAHQSRLPPHPINTDTMSTIGVIK